MGHYPQRDMPRASFSHTAVVERPLDAIWERLQLADTWRGIGPIEDVWDPTHGEDGVLTSYQWSANVGPRTYRGTARTTEATIPERLQLAIDGGEIRGTLTTELESLDGTGSTQLTVSLDLEATSGMTALLFPVIAEVVGRGLPTQVDRFAAEVGQ